ncbi:hypothetical protein DF122_16925 [Burkholderia pseudomallei]|nr:hypothetical protein [Burkholderia pseudomallei]RPE20877.1 hypothetical protein DF127_10435 [Burkholderia pseudomallei]RPE23564.1 hypothetical protein DF068_10395 [Burkholderia pseudomallei]RQS91567.1 hypothetical protein DF125_17785 [Burkholderia pseudomallei]RQZ54528.1 hypothetical protein DF060_10730 [Burkholderia pseudomallei]
MRRAATTAETGFASRRSPFFHALLIRSPLIPAPPAGIARFGLPADRPPSPGNRTAVASIASIASITSIARPSR